MHGSKRAELRALAAENRHSFQACVLRERFDRLWTYETRPGVLNFLMGWFQSLWCHCLPQIERLGEVLPTQVRGIAAHCDHPVRVGVVESIDSTVTAVLRRAHGVRGEATLVLKLKWATARPVRFARDSMRFLTVQPPSSDR